MRIEAHFVRFRLRKLNRSRLTAPVVGLVAMCTACDLSLPALKVWETESPAEGSDGREGSDSSVRDNTDAPADSAPPSTDTDGRDTTQPSTDPEDRDSSSRATDTDIEDSAALSTASDNVDSETGENATESEPDSDTIPQASCETQPNFTLCRAKTAPDRDFDICIDGKCLSPGCGTAECNIPGLSFPLPDTGQDRCFDHIREIPCTGADTTFTGQDGQYGWDVTHDEGERFITSTALQSDEPVVEDLVTGLVWQGCTAGLEGVSCEEGTANQLSWDEALDYCNALGWGKKAGWRLPSRCELMSILNLGRETDASFHTVFPNTPVDYSFWSIDTLSSTPQMAYGVDFAVGYLFTLKKESPFYHVRCIWSGNQTVPKAERPFERATDVEDTPTVLQSNARKTWQGCAAGRFGADCKQGELLKMDWKGALAYCEGLEWAGLQSWRLPNVFEMLSITEAEIDKPVFDPVLFPETPVGEEVAMWTATTVAADDLSADAWTVTATSGITLIQMKNEPNFYVRCVSDAL